MPTVECVQSPAAFFANRLHKAMDGAGTDDATLIRIIVSRSEIDLETIKQEFERIYNRTLLSAIVVSAQTKFLEHILIQFQLLLYVIPTLLLLLVIVVLVVVVVFGART